MKFYFSRFKRLRKRIEFLRLQKKSNRFNTKYLIVTFAVNGSNVTARLGITATKKIGHAVIRNRGKRLVREAFRRHQEKFPPNIDMVVILRHGIESATQAEIDQALLLASRKMS